MTGAVGKAATQQAEWVVVQPVIGDVEPQEPTVRTERHVGENGVIGAPERPVEAEPVTAVTAAPAVPVPATEPEAEAEPRNRVSRPMAAAAAMVGLVLVLAAVAIPLLSKGGDPEPLTLDGTPAVHDGPTNQPGMVPQADETLPEIPTSAVAAVPQPDAPTPQAPADQPAPRDPAAGQPAGQQPAPNGNAAAVPAPAPPAADQQAQQQAQQQAAPPRPTGEVWTGPACGNAPAYTRFEAAGYQASGEGCGRSLWLGKSGDPGRDGSHGASWSFDVGTGVKRCDVYVLIPNDKSHVGNGDEATLYTIHDGTRQVGQPQFVQAKFLGKWVSVGGYPVSGGTLKVVLHDRGRGAAGAMHVAALTKLYCT
ncbi:hypothetical protein ACIGNX_01515 [Actinosynnema sp. NPDC053489]|uniref:hypothetical protein n=1 Tax=Actinosynnema sp. NPDC053489 TaxID=3363916 RepID=UPI0037CA8A3D